MKEKLNKFQSINERKKKPQIFQVSRKKKKETFNKNLSHKGRKMKTKTKKIQVLI